jgi:tetratricopeptide (TPR) repeat protein
MLTSKRLFRPEEGRPAFRNQGKRTLSPTPEANIGKEGALQNLEPLSSQPIEEVYSLFDAAQAMMRKGAYEGAEPILLRFAEELPDHDHGKVWYELAEVFAHKGELQRAKSAYLRALEVEWNDIYALAYSSFLWEIGQEKEALSFLMEFKKRISAGAVASPPGVSIDSMIDAIASGVSYEQFWADRWPPKGQNSAK